MAKLPLTVTSVVPTNADTYRVTVAYADGTLGNFLVPVTMATIEAVTISALVYAQLSDPAIAQNTYPHRVTRRYLSR